MTWTLIAVNCLIFFFELAMPESALEHFFYVFGLVPARYTHPAWAIWLGLPIDDYWPFLTNMFLHGGWVHLIGNIWTLWIFGDNVEDRMGPYRFLFFYLSCGLAGSLAHLYTNPASTIPAFGASGAIAGVMGAYFVLFPRSRVIVLIPVLFMPLFFEFPAFLYLGVWALGQFFSGTLSLAYRGYPGGVAWWAHVGGFAAGIVLHFFFVKSREDYRRFSRDEYDTATAWVPAGYWRKSQ